MHMADALISPAVAGTMYACSTAAAAYSIKKVRIESKPEKIPVMGVMGAFVFATQMINITIPGTGASGHLAGGMLLTALLGPYASFLTMIGVLLIQCLLFADGGILALGCNIWNMAFYGCFLGYFLFWRPIQRGGFTRKKIIASSIIGSILTLQLGAFSVVLQTWMSGITSLPFSVFVAAMQPIHLAIGVVEGLITAAVLLFIYEARPALLEEERREASSKISLKKVILILGGITIIIAVALSLAASENPDGLEWSIARITGDTEIEAGAGESYQKAEELQSFTAVLPDYGFKDKESNLATSFSGIIGSVLVLAVCLLACYGFNFFRNKRVIKNE